MCPAWTGSGSAALILLWSKPYNAAAVAAYYVLNAVLHSAAPRPDE